MIKRIRNWWSSLSNEHKALILFFIGMCLNRVCSLLPLYRYFDPFPWYDIVDKHGNNVGITLQSYIYMIAGHINTILIWIGIRYVVPQFRQLMYNFAVIDFFSLIDFLARYEKFYFMLFGFYPFEFTDVKLILIALFIIRWKYYNG